MGGAKKQSSISFHERTTMKKTASGLVLLALASLALCQCSVQTTTQLKAFTDWPAGLSPAEVGKKLATNMLPRWIPTRPGVHYAEDSTWMTALKFAALTKDEELKTALIKRFDPILAPGGQSAISMTRHVDHNIFGIVPLELYIQTKDKRYLDIGKMLADRQWEQPDANGLTDETRFWIDDMYMITILQVEAFRATGDKVYLDRAALEMVAYLDKLQQPNGLFYHGTNFPFFWGRGDGWVAAGMPELLSELPPDHPKRARIMEGYKKMMEALLKYQDTDGMWHQLIDHPESYKESSCTAMFTYAFITGVKKGWLTDPAYAEGARKGWLALQNNIDADGNVDKVCVGTGQNNSLQFYLNRPTQKGNPHGQAPVLWCAVALLR
jgi:rhamnogalacturonyl hydrolase YesR